MFALRLFPWIRQCSTVVKNDRYVIGYASGNFGKAILLGSVDVTLLFLLTDIIGIAPARVALLMVLVLAGDLVFDVVAGLIASRAERHGIGYPRLIVLFAVPCALAFFAIYCLPLLQVKEFAVIGVLLLCLRGAFAIIDVPHNSLLARVTADSHARGRASGYRTIFSSAASVSVACVISPLMQAAAADGAPVRMAWLGALGGVLFCSALFVAAWSSKASHIPVQPPPRQPAAATLSPVPDRLFAAMAAIALLTGFCTPMFTKTLLYLGTYVLKSSEFAGQVLLVLALSQMLGAVIWISLVRRWDKSTLLAMSHGVAAVGIVLFAAAAAGAGVTAAADENHHVLLALTAVIGVGFAGVFMLPWGILADIIDFAEFRHRERRETASFAAMLVLLKGGGAAALATIGWALGMLGYTPGGEQPGSVLFGMKLLGFGVPVAGSVIAILILRRMDIGHAVHARVSRANRVRRERVHASACRAGRPRTVRPV